MKLLFSSDLHGLDSAYRNFSWMLKSGSYQIGVLAGDLMTFSSDHDIKEASDEYDRLMPDQSSRAGNRKEQIVQIALQRKEIQYKAILHESGKIVLFVMGNDDGLLGKGLEWESDKRIVNVNMRRVKYGNLNFVGYQYTNPYVGGTFEKDEPEQEEDLLTLQRLVDENTVLITHGPPQGILDNVGNGINAGSKALRNMIKKKRPLLHLFGHIHQGFGIEGRSVNGSYPRSRKFIEVDLDMMDIKEIDEEEANDTS